MRKCGQRKAEAGGLTQSIQHLEAWEGVPPGSPEDRKTAANLVAEQQQPGREEVPLCSYPIWGRTPRTYCVQEVLIRRTPRSQILTDFCVRWTMYAVS